MAIYYVEQKAELWLRTEVEANSFEEALELGENEIRDGIYEEQTEGFELVGSFWVMNSETKETETVVA